MLPGQQIWSELAPRLAALHQGVEPIVASQAELGPDAGGPPLCRIVAYPATDPAPHWHFVTCGLCASRFIPGYPGVGDIELTFRLGREAKERTPPKWVAPFLQQLGQIAFQQDTPVAIEHPIDLAGLLPVELNTAVTAGYCVEDPLVATGSIRLVQLVALTRTERTRVEILANHRSKLVLEISPAGISDLERERVPAADASPPPRPAPPPKPEPRLETIRVSKEGARMRVSIAAREVGEFIEAIAASVRAGRVSFVSHGWTVHLAVEDVARSATWATTLMIYFTLELSKQVAAELGDPGRHDVPLRYPPLPDLEFFVVADGAKSTGEKGSVLKRLGHFFGIP